MKLIGWKDRDKTLLVDPDEINCLKMVSRLNDAANSIYELYNHPNPACESGSAWKDIVLSPSRLNIQQELKYSIRKLEGSTWFTEWQHCNFTLEDYIHKIYRWFFCKFCNMNIFLFSLFNDVTYMNSTFAPRSQVQFMVMKTTTALNYSCITGSHVLYCL